jgi:hypothetical protein
MTEPEPFDPSPSPESLATPSLRNEQGEHYENSEPVADLRTLLLPWEGVEALRTVLGILDDHEVRVDTGAYESISVKLLDAVMMGPQDGDIPVNVSIAEANLLLEGLRFTDIMSMDLPFYDAVVDTINFVGEQLLALWTNAEWLAFHDTKHTPLR